tara:strand:- start:219 stop:572 length:354 start_codon:yes stop_codon:yes gene_type:complete
MNILFIGIGGGLGAISRFLVNEAFFKYLSFTFPLGILFVNILGCFLIGLFLGLSMPEKDSSYYFFIIGFLGSFTTMSAFTHQTILMMNTNILIAASYIIITITLSIVATYCGALLAR